MWFLLFFAALDISADLVELGRTPVAVISAGVKSILDVGRTLEYLVSSMQFTLQSGGEGVVRLPFPIM